MSEAMTQRVRLFERPLPDAYREELRLLMAEKPRRDEAKVESLLLFRVGPLRLAVSMGATWAIAPALHVARIPHRSGTVLLGLVAHRGELLPCCSLARLLSVEADSSAGPRTLILEGAARRRWALPIDAVLGIRAGGDTSTGASCGLPAPWVRSVMRDDDGEFLLLAHDFLFRQLHLATA